MTASDRFPVPVRSLVNQIQLLSISAVADEPARRAANAANVLQTKVNVQCNKLATELS